MTEKETIKLLHEALTAAQEHLVYCGYGDSYEREAADASGLPKTIDKALAAGNKFLEKQNDQH